MNYIANWIEMYKFTCYNIITPNNKMPVKYSILNII